MPFPTVTLQGWRYSPRVGGEAPGAQKGEGPHTRPHSWSAEEPQLRLSSGQFQNLCVFGYMKCVVQLERERVGGKVALPGWRAGGGGGGWGVVWRHWELSASSARLNLSTPEMNLLRKRTTCFSKCGTSQQLPRGCAWKMLASPPWLKNVSPCHLSHGLKFHHQKVCPWASVKDIFRHG